MADSTRVKLTITEVKDIEEVGANKIPKLSFKAKDGEKDYWYFTFSKRLFDYIKPDTEIDCDVAISTREYEGNTYTDRKVTQIYIDGQPVVSKQQGGYRGKSPEQTLAEIDSKFRDTALMQAIEFSKYIEGETINEDFILGIADRFYKWLSQGQTLESKAPEPKKEDELFPEKKSMGEMVTGDLKNLPIKNLGDLFTACQKHFKMSQSAVLKELGGIAKEQIADPLDAWLQIVEMKS